MERSRPGPGGGREWAVPLLAVQTWGPGSAGQDLGSGGSLGALLTPPCGHDQPPPRPCLWPRTPSLSPPRGGPDLGCEALPQGPRTERHRVRGGAGRAHEGLLLAARLSSGEREERAGLLQARAL